ncbi:hypothetical protein N1F78_02725 [Seonamhaeicola sp. MEBiC1930]|uniref:hypothetical protein n=1 Tax=Seonamhaeicola sp. MEBiC01930 TaxID=2976768 RepID=UPI0032441D8A
MISNNNSVESYDNMIISFSKPFHLLIRQKSFSDIFAYRKFLNWVSGEFDLNLQDKSDNLKIFFPNKRLSISKLERQNNCIISEIKIEAISIPNGMILLSSIESIYLNLIKNLQ